MSAFIGRCFKNGIFCRYFRKKVTFFLNCNTADNTAPCTYRKFMQRIIIIRSTGLGGRCLYIIDSHVNFVSKISSRM